jgi:hypothetical protein
MNDLLLQVVIMMKMIMMILLLMMMIMMTAEINIAFEMLVMNLIAESYCAV